MAVESLLLQNVLQKYSDLPLAEERWSFLAYKLEAGSSWSTLRQTATYMAAAVSRLNLTSETRLSPDQIERAAQEWANRRPRAVNLINPEKLARHFRFVVGTWFSFMGRLDLPELRRPDPYSSLLTDFARFLKDARGLAPATIECQCAAARQFLRDQALDRIQNHEIGMKAILDHITALRSRGYSRTSMAGHVYRLRSFFRYAEQKGKMPAGLWHGLTPPRIYSDERLPLAPRWDDVQLLLKDADTDKAVDIRDRAIMLLLSVYGLRSAEVRSLRVQDIDWHNKVLRVPRPKQRTHASFPLADTVGVAIRRYLDKARPQSKDDRLFLRMKAPLAGLSRSGVSTLIRSRIKALGIVVTRFGAHGLRHACAARLLDQGLSFKTIGDHLGHRSADATRIYAKIDLVGLRQVADFDFGGLL
jgi:site-specific recombinase XerD